MKQIIPFDVPDKVGVSFAMSLEDWLLDMAPRSEWIDGNVCYRRMQHTDTSMGQTRGHGMIVTRLLMSLKKGVAQRYEALVSGCAVQTRPTTYRLPDALVVDTHDPELHSDSVVLKPVLIAEVVSPGTTALDYCEKMHEYLALEHLYYYLIVDPQQQAVCVFERANGTITLRNYTFTDQLIDLPALSGSLDTAELSVK